MTNDVGVLINNEARMTNDEGMTKSEVQKPSSANDSFPNEDVEWVIREPPDKNRVYDLEERTDCWGGARAEAAGTRVMDGSQGATLDLLKKSGEGRKNE
jgi:hypothetical protein